MKKPKAPDDAMMFLLFPDGVDDKGVLKYTPNNMRGMRYLVERFYKDIMEHGNLPLA